MKLNICQILAVVLTISMVACQHARENKVMADQFMATDSLANLILSSSAAVEDGKDQNHKFIRTADLKFKVRNVAAATGEVEDITRRLGGFVTFTNLGSVVDNKVTTAVSEDSSLEMTYYSVVNEMTLRVPNRQLDSTLKAISSLVEYLDYRVIKADDVTLDRLGNRMAQDRLSVSGQRLTRAIDSRGKKLNETTAAEDLLLSQRAGLDSARLADLSLQDQVTFSTIKLSLYQRQAIMRELIPNDRGIDAYAPDFGNRIAGAIGSGWRLLESIVVFVAQFWAVLLIGAVALIVYKRYFRRTGKLARKELVPQ